MLKEIHRLDIPLSIDVDTPNPSGLVKIEDHF